MEENKYQILWVDNTSNKFTRGYSSNIVDIISKDYEEKIKHVLADYQNLNRQTQSNIEKGVNTKIDEFMLDFLKIYDDFIFVETYTLKI